MHLSSDSRTPATWMLSFVLVLIGTSASTAEDRVIETEVFVGKSNHVAERHVTIFTDDKIYDIRTEPDRFTIVFDRTTKRFLIGQAMPPMQTSLTADDLIQFTARLQSKAASSTDPVVKFAASPKFTETYDEQSGRLQLKSSVWEYDVQVQSVSDKTTRERYREFADWFSYLNAMFRPLPPGARLKLNQALDQHSVIPKQVSVVVRFPGGEIEQRSEHKLRNRLNDADQQLLGAWEDEQRTLKIVEFARFHATSGQTAAAKQRSDRK